jgi:predicted amidohydrolase
MSDASTLTIAAAQMSSQDDVTQNLARAAALVEEAAARGARLVVLPENFAYMGTEDGKRQVAERLDGPERGPIVTNLARAAQKSAVHVIAGGMPERSADLDRPHNTSIVVAPDGAIVARYRKIHLFDVDVGDGHAYRESSNTSAGDEGPAVVDIAGFRVGLSICYDLRFPELYRKLSDRGAEIITVPAAFTLATGKDHWHVLLRARAIEAQAYVIAAAQWGTHPRGRRTFGKSLVADPWGEIVAQCSEGEGIALAIVDRAYLRHVRQSLPSLTHRRPLLC